VIQKKVDIAIPRAAGILAGSLPGICSGWRRSKPCCIRPKRRL